MIMCKERKSIHEKENPIFHPVISNDDYRYIPDTIKLYL